MSEPTTYEIVIRGRASARLLRPLLDDFAFDHASDGVTRLIGDIRDTSHLHGVLAHLASVNTEVISVAPLRPAPEDRTWRPAGPITAPLDLPLTHHHPRSAQP